MKDVRTGVTSAAAGCWARSDRRWVLIAGAAAVAVIGLTMLALTAGPARAADDLTPAARLAVRIADRLPADEVKRSIKAYRQARSQTPPQDQRLTVRAAAVAPPICRSAFPPGVARNICAQMLSKIKTGGEATAKCGVGIVAVVARPALKTAALLAKNCGPPAAALAVGAASAYLSKHCKAIAPFFLDFTCDLLF